MSRTFITVMVVVFIAGLGGGVLVDRVVLNKPMLRARVVARDLSPVLDKLDLTREQRARIDSILAERAPASESVMIRLADEMRAVSDSVDRELRAILTPAQRARLDSLRPPQPQFVLKRKTSGGSSVDTIPVRDSSRPPD
jgi:hypothetical protein